MRGSSRAIIGGGALGLVMSCVLVVAPARADDRCTNQIDYASDPRSNAEINSIGASIGHCPAPMASGPTTGEGGKFFSIQQFGNAYSGAVCSQLSADPQRHTIWSMVSVWMTQTNLDYTQLQQGIGYAIGTYCPQFNGIYQSYRSYYP